MNLMESGDGGIRLNAGDIPSSDSIMERGKKRGFDGLNRNFPRYRTSQEKIDALKNSVLRNISFSSSPVYNPRIYSEGKTSIHPKTGETLKIEIGLQLSERDSNLIDTLIHEELEARIARRAFRNNKKWSKLFDDKNEAMRHWYINKVIVRFFLRRGIVK